MYSEHLLSSYNEQFDLPLELCSKALALIGVSGLDTINNAIHKTIWENLSSNRRVERSPVLFKLINNADEFPTVKPKRNSFEWYIPKGILKKNWMKKHSTQLPACIVIFFDLDWNDSHWNEKVMECASRVHSFRAALEGRNTRLVVVLLQTAPPFPGEDSLGTERAAALCTNCEINSKSLFILPHNDHLQGYVVRLESAFYELAQQYYQSLIRTVESHKEQLNKNNHQYLFVRHQFKLGFLNELKQDVHAAHKHYTYAYNKLNEIRILDTNALEVLLVAEFINYKLCKLLFELNLPRDAISQFRAHVEKFRGREVFNKELAFEHYAWLSKQYNIFGDVFDEAVKLGLPAVQTQHPGVYYQQAAQHAVERKKIAIEICANVNSYPSDPDPLEGFKNVEFFGQRSWKSNKVAIENPSLQLEKKGIEAIQFLEKQTVHSNIIIALYGLAVSQYKTYKCPRTRRHLVVKMAEEYYEFGDYGKALTLFSHMICDYRLERWFDILSHVLRRALECAFLTAVLLDYVTISLELLGKNITASHQYKKQTYQNLMKVLKKEVPDSPFAINEKNCIKSLSLWKKTIEDGKLLNMKIDMNPLISCVETKARFLKNQYEVDQNATVEIFVRSTCPFPMNFTRLSVTINTEVSTSEFAVNETQFDNPNLKFESGEVKKYVLEFRPSWETAKKDVQISSISLYLGDVDKCQIELQFNGNINFPISEQWPRRSSSVLDFDAILPQLSAYVSSRKSKLKIVYENSQPALVGECFHIIVRVTNDDVSRVNNFNLIIDLATSDTDVDGDVEFCLNPSRKCETIPLNLNLTDLEVGESEVVDLYIRGHKNGRRTLKFKYSYTLENGSSTSEDFLNVSFVQPFQITTKFYTELFEEISKFYVDENFVIMPTISCKSPWPLVIEKTTIDLMPPFQMVDDDIDCQLSNIVLSDNESACEVFLVKNNKKIEKITNIAQYTIKWKRQDNGHLATSILPVMGLEVDYVPINLKLSLPAYGFVRTPLLVTYTLYNKSEEILQFDVSVDASDAFMFSGYKQTPISILPENEKTLTYNLYPLVAGNVVLPKFSINVPEDGAVCVKQSQINSLIERALPSHFFIMPQSKGSPQIDDKEILQLN